MTTFFNRSLYRGDSLTFPNQVFQDLNTLDIFTVPITTPPTQPPPNSVPYNLTGATVWFTAKNSIVDPDSQAVIELSSGSLGGVTLTQPVAGKFLVGPAPTLAFLLTADSEVDLAYDIQVKDSAGRVTTVERGILAVLPDVTRATS